MSKPEIDSLLFKPFAIKDESGQEKLFIFIGGDETLNKTLSDKGKLTKKNIYILYLFDITDTINSGEAVINNWQISDWNKFKSNLREVPFRECGDLLVMSSNIIVDEINNLTKRASDLNQAITVVRHIAKKAGNGDDIGTIVINGSENNLTQIVFKTITGDSVDLKKDDVDKIGEVIMEIVMDHAEDNLDDPEQLKKIRSEIEYKVVEALPDYTQAKNIKINMDAIIEEIKKMKGN